MLDPKSVREGRGRGRPTPRGSPLQADRDPGPELLPETGAFRSLMEPQGRWGGSPCDCRVHTAALSRDHGRQGWFAATRPHLRLRQVPTLVIHLLIFLECL